MIVLKTLGSGISGAVRYVLGEGKRDPVTGQTPELVPGESSRVAWFGGTGFGFPIDSARRLDIARGMMEWAAHDEMQASKTKRCVEDCLHLSLSWDPGERPTRAEMEAAAHSALAKLGMGQARAIFVCHNDTDHAHVHLVISRINPANGMAFSDRFDTVDLSAWALSWEQDHGGVRCEARLENAQRRAERDPEKIVQAYAAARESFTVFDLNRELTKAIPSRDARHAFINQVLARPDIVRLADPVNGQVMRYTTRQTLAAEHLAEVLAARLYADASHKVSVLALHAVQERLSAEGKALRSDQLDVLRHASGAEGLGIIVGKAGTGKSFTMSAIAAVYAADGYAVQSLAPNNKVVAALRRDGLEARTLQSALGSLDRGKVAWDDRTVIMVDEAGMISTRLLARLLSHAEQAGAKIILVGDEKQLASMGRGGMFGYLAGLHGAGELTEITRQRGAEQRELATRASQYDFGAALTTLAGQGGIVRVDSPDDRIARAAEIWGERSARHPDGSLFVITVSNVEAQAANLAIRDIRHRRGELGVDHMLTTADGPQAFAAGDRILFSGSAANRDGRDAGLVNGNAGTIAAIEGARVSVALDGAKPGETVSFTVGKNREAGEFMALKHGYAGTVYKSQGATFDRAILIDSAAMRSSTAYVALTRHRETVTVVTARGLQPGFESWMAAEGGLAALTDRQRDSAERSYETWRTETNPEAGRRHSFADYVAYVQGKEAERRGEGSAPGRDIADMAKRWGRIDDRRAASRFTAQGYEPPDTTRRLTPVEVRAAVGVEVYEQGEGPGAALPKGPEIVTPGMQGTVVPLRPTSQEATPVETVADRTAPTMRVEDRVRDQDLPGEDQPRQQADRQRIRLRELQRQEDRAQAYRRACELEAEEARKKEAEHKEAEARDAQDGDIGSASARYAIALGDNYDMRDPYASLARAAMAEYAAFHRTQEKLRAEMSGERDPDKRRVIELRRQIEACHYMEITSTRLAGISVAITGRLNAEQAVADREKAATYGAQAAALRTERSELIEAIRQRVEVTVTPAGAADSDRARGAFARQDREPPAAVAEAEPAAAMPATQPEPAFFGPRPSAPINGQPAAEAHEPTGAVTVATAPDPEPSSLPAHVQPEAAIGEMPDRVQASATPQQLVLDIDDKAGPDQPSQPAGAAPDAVQKVQAAPVSVSPILSRPDVIQPPPAPPLVTMARDAEIASALSPEQQSSMPWMDVLRRRVAEAEAAPSSGEVSESAIAKLARRLREAEKNPPEVGKDQGKETGPEIEPDM